MTKKDYLDFISGCYHPSCPCQFGGLVVSQVAPKPENGMALQQVSKPLEQKQFNGLTFTDLHILSKNKYMDSLHAADRVAAINSRANYAKDYVSKHGLDNFMSNYK